MPDPLRRATSVVYWEALPSLGSTSSFNQASCRSWHVSRGSSADVPHCPGRHVVRRAVDKFGASPPSHTSRSGRGDRGNPADWPELGVSEEACGGVLITSFGRPGGGDAS